VQSAGQSDGCDDLEMTVLLHGRFVRLGVVAAAIGAVAATSACSSDTTASSDRSVIDNNAQSAGGILRAYIGGTAFDLRIQRMSLRSDAGGGPPRCLDAAGPVQFDVNWAAANGHSSVPKVTVTITTPDRAILTLGATSDGCWPARDTTFEAMSSGTQLVLSAALPKTEANVAALRVTINGVITRVPMRPTCTYTDSTQQSMASTQPPCADDPLNFDPTNGSSVEAHIR
jgi:hypothetical protein